MAMKLLWFVLVYIDIQTIHGESMCHMYNVEMTCDSIRTTDLNRNMSVILSDESVVDLNITNSFIAVINRQIFGKYTNMHTLELSDSNVRSVEIGAFSDLIYLRNVHLENNFLEALDSGIFHRLNTIQVLDISRNVINDLSKFNVSSFSHLVIMNISYNRLESLPECFVRKLRDSNNFHLVIDNNPWNCSHPIWVNHLDQTMMDAFCSNKSYNPQGIRKSLSWKNNLSNINDECGNQQISTCHVKCCFSKCTIWFFGAIWIGVILGNVCTIRKLICISSARLEDKNTQYDKMDLLARV